MPMISLRIGLYRVAGFGLRVAGHGLRATFRFGFQVSGVRCQQTDDKGQLGRFILQFFHLFSVVLSLSSEKLTPESA